MCSQLLPRLRQAFPGVEERSLRLVHMMMHGQLCGYQDLPEETKKWIDSCYNPPCRDEVCMHVINIALGGYGVEAIRGNWVDHYHQDIVATYVNMGDTYTTTIVWPSEGSPAIVSMGDWVERNQETLGIV